MHYATVTKVGQIKGKIGMFVYATTMYGQATVPFNPDVDYPTNHAQARDALARKMRGTRVGVGHAPVWHTARLSDGRYVHVPQA